MNQKTLQFNHIFKQYGYIDILKDINVDLCGGDLLILIGPNGAGKSTLLKILSTQIKPTRGDFFYNDIPVYKNLNDYKRRLSYVSHKTFLYDELSAYQNLLFFAKLYNIKDPAKKINEFLDFFELKNRKDDPVKYFSRGMQQKLSIARAMINDPQFIYLDEPYTGLDNRAEKMLNTLILKKKAEGSIILLVTHDLEKSFDIATKIMILNKGMQYFFGNKNDIMLSEIKEMYMTVLER